MSSALISNIQGYSIHDGPGIRTTVFVMGCPLRCKWCANPENLEARRRVGFIRQLCRECEACSMSCPKGAIIPDDNRIIRELCVDCGICTQVCDTGALLVYGKSMSAGEVFDQVRKDKMFYSSSGGGVTVSGGEPLLYPAFLRELFTLCREDGIPCCIESCVSVPRESLDAVLPLLDCLFVDLKLIDPQKHKEYTGSDNAAILANARHLAELHAPVRFRQPLIPGITDTDSNLADTAAFLQEIGIPELELMPYHRAGSSKYAALGIPYPTAKLPAMSIPEAEAIAAKYLSLGIRCTVSK